MWLLVLGFLVGDFKSSEVGFKLKKTEVHAKLRINLSCAGHKAVFASSQNGQWPCVAREWSGDGSKPNLKKYPHAHTHAHAHARVGV